MFGFYAIVKRYERLDFKERSLVTFFNNYSLEISSNYRYNKRLLSAILGSSVVERSAVNRLVVGSNPTRGV
jgi:hypothetical protein